VHPERRGRGHSRTALLASIRHAGWLGTDDLVLWTGKPDVYEASGFKLYDTALYGWASGLSAPGRAGAVRAPWPTPGEQRGLPPFASKAYHWTTPFASAIVVHDASGPILAEWSGSDEEVVALLAQAMPERWRINVLFSDTLPATLRKTCAAVDLKPSNLQMVLNLRRRDDQSTDPYRLRVLDRI
jgi:hypothetical protein